MTVGNRDCPLAQAAEAWPNQPAVVSDVCEWTFAEWHAEADRIARELRSRGWRAGDRLGIRGQGSAKLLALLVACLRCEVTCCLVSPRWPPALLDFASQQTLWQAYWEAGKSLPARRERQDASPWPGNVATHATILFSSGSTGRPKAMAHSLRAHLANADGANTNLPLQVGDVWLLSLSPAHVGGLGIIFRCLLAGATIAIPEAGEPLATALRRWRPTHLSLVPTQFKRLLDQEMARWPELRRVLLGGSPIPASLIRRAVDAAWPLMTTYGLSEMGSQVTATCPDANRDELGTAGTLLPGRELHVTGSGEILVRGEMLLSGWIENGILVSATDDQGWYATRDLGRLDEKGRLIVTGRADNQFISGGENIHPEEIEQALLEWASITQVVVVPIDHEEYGQRPIAFVESTQWDPDGWDRHLTARLARFMRPDAYYPMPEQMGDKPSRTQLRELARKCHPPID